MFMHYLYIIYMSLYNVYKWIKVVEQLLWWTDAQKCKIYLIKLIDPSY